MKHKRIEWFVLVAALMLALPLAALAQSSAPPSSQQPPTSSGQATPPTTTQSAPATDTQSTPTPAVQPQASAETQAKTEVQVKLDAILAKGEKTPAKTRADVDNKLAATTRKVDDNAAKEGDPKTAERLSAQYGMSADAITSEKQQLGASWGELMILHTIAANTTSSGLTPEQIFEMRKAGKGWAQISAGMGLKLGDVVSAAQSESKIAMGLSKSEGKVAQIHSTESKETAKVTDPSGSSKSDDADKEKTSSKP
jgi:hypothetical protein